MRNCQKAGMASNALVLAAGVALSAEGAADVPGLLRLSAEEKALKEGQRQGR